MGEGEVTIPDEVTISEWMTPPNGIWTFIYTKFKLIYNHSMKKLLLLLLLSLGLIGSANAGDVYTCKYVTELITNVTGEKVTLGLVSPEITMIVENKQVTTIQVPVFSPLPILISGNPRALSSAFSFSTYKRTGCNRFIWKMYFYV